MIKTGYMHALGTFAMPLIAYILDRYTSDLEGSFLPYFFLRMASLPNVEVDSHPYLLSRDEEEQKRYAHLAQSISFFFVFTIRAD